MSVDYSATPEVEENGGAAGPEVEVIASPRRRKSVQARLVGGRIQVRVPAAMSAAEREKAVARVVASLRRKMRAGYTEAQLRERARRLNAEYLEGRARADSVRWVSNQQHRWGSCTVSTGDIRISDRLRDVPAYVLDAVLIHELVHTFVPGGHSAEFYRWADRAPRAERARGFLEAYQRYGRGG
ncbi:M48 family metallopeptidase [Corynebacterium oculi]|uniref:SprT-like family protein n=1 Tax=Corynebacterium oculi TaxID=1544416 RepID=A0A0Q1DVA8_9CORY|nr:SprT-like domain-containing protein [Corynebacterium oculi]KQB84111.1 SprT-like family protein [Corynebacterium oculi]